MTSEIRVHIKEGSDLYYASVYLNRKIRHHVSLIELLRREISHIPESCSDPDVARAKLVWWMEELRCSKEYLSRHPLTKAISLEVQLRTNLLDALLALTLKIHEDIVPKNFCDHDALTNHLHYLNSELITIMAHFFEIVPSGDCNLILDLACSIERSNALLGLREHRNAPTLYFCEPDIRAYGLTIQSIRSAQSSAAIEEFIQNQIVVIKTDLIFKLSQISQKLKKKSRFFTTQAEINLQVLDLSLKAKGRVLEGRMELLPIKKLWLAWKLKTWG